MKKITKLGVLVGAVSALVGMAAPAMAAPPTGAAGTTTGFDGNPNVFVTEGSDTSFFVSNLLGELYNQTNGCSLNLAAAVPFDGCAAASSPIAGPRTASQLSLSTNTIYANWDHDRMLNMFPIGSGNGRTCLTTPANCTQPVDLVRSSSGLGALTGVTNWQFAKEGVAIVAVNPAARARTTGTLAVTKAQLQGLFEDNNNICESTLTWGQLGDGGPNAGDLVVPFGMQAGSGTFGTMNGYVANPTSINGGDCVVGSNLPFENDVEELINRPETAPTYTAGTGLWWISGAVVNNFPWLSRTLAPMTVDTIPFTNANVNSGAYPLSRTVSFIARTTDAGAAAVGGRPSGTTTGTGGAARMFLEWLCKGPGEHINNPNVNAGNSVNYSTLISGAISKAGLVGFTAGTTFGRCVSNAA